MEELYYKRTAQSSMWVGRDLSIKPYPFVSETFLKGPNYVQRWDLFKPYLLPDIELSCLRTGLRSPRPYMLGQSCDRSISALVLLFYHDFCKANGLNGRDLYNTAYADEDPIMIEEWEEIIDFAHWQEVVVPKQWCPKNMELLMQSITHVNESSLRELLELYLDNQFYVLDSF